MQRRLLFLAVFGLSMLVLGRELQRRHAPDALKAIPSQLQSVWRTSALNRAMLPELERLVIDLSFEDYQRIAADRELALERGVLLPGAATYVPARLRAGDDDVRAKVRLKGDIRHNWTSNKWSMRVKVRGEHTLLGMKWFSLQDPNAGDGLQEWALLEMLRRDGIPAIRYRFVDLTINGTDLGVFALEEHFEKRLIEHNRRREGPIVKFSEDLKWEEWYRFRTEEEGIGSLATSAVEPMDWDDGQTALFREALSLMAGFQHGTLAASEAFDLPLMARYVAYKEVAGASELDWNDLRFYFNPITARLEPIAYEMHSSSAPIERLFAFAGGMKRRRRYFLEQPDSFSRLLFSDEAFSRAYVEELDRISRPGHFEKLYAGLETEMEDYLKVLRAEYPQMAPPDLDILRENQRRIHSFLYPEKPIHAYVTSEDGATMSLKIGNLQSLPVEVLSAGTRASSQTLGPVILPPRRYFGTPELHEFELPLAASSTALDSITVQCRVLGTEGEIRVPVYPWDIQPDEPRVALAQMPSNLGLFEFVHELEDGSGWYVEPGEWTIRTSLIVPEGGVLQMGPGTHLRLEDGASIISHSALELRGSDDAPVRMSSHAGGGLFVLGAERRSQLEHVLLEGMSPPRDADWELTGAVTFYETSVTLSDVYLSQMTAEDSLNLVRSPFELNGVTIRGAFSDALDVDFSDGKLFDCRFLDSGNDAIDISGSRVYVEQVEILRAGDKGLSVGEASWMHAVHVDISDAEIAVASKDNSSIELRYVEIDSSQVAFAAYQKKPEFGPARIDAENVVLDPRNTPHLIERGSFMDLNWYPHEGKLENVAAGIYASEEVQPETVQR